MFESIISFFADTNVAAVAVFLTVYGVYYITIPFWVGAAAAKIKDLFYKNTTHKMFLIRCICVFAAITVAGVLPYALLWAFTNFATVTVSSIIVFVMDKAVLRTLYFRDMHYTVFAVN